MLTFAWCRHLLAPTLAAGLATMAGCTGEPAQTYGETARYAESVYGNYQEAAAGRIAFDVATLQAGELDEIADIPVNQLVGVPDYWLRMTPRGTEITSIVRESRAAGSDDWETPVNLREFDRLGRPVAAATYRLLAVTTSLPEAEAEAGAESVHQALEVCWAADAFCIVMDPVVLQADSYLHDRARMLAEGWAPIETSTKAVTTAGACTLNSKPTVTQRSLTYPGWWVEYKNVFGMVLVRKDMGAQQVGISCFVNSAGACVSSGFGSSNTSSCFANLGYTCDCDNTGSLIGTSADGSSTKAWSESICTHRAFLSASASWTIEGQAAGFNVNWDTAGSEDANGGQLFDSCSFH